MDPSTTGPALARPTASVGGGGAALALPGDGAVHRRDLLGRSAFALMAAGLWLVTSPDVTMEDAVEEAPAAVPA